MATSQSPISRQPDKLDYASPTQFKFGILQLPKVEFLTVSANVPGISGTPAVVNPPFKNIPTMGDKLEYENLSISFIVDEYLENYLSIYNWITGQGFPESRQQFVDFRDTTSETSDLNTAREGRKGDRSMYSDATLTILSNKNNPIVEVRFKDMFPISLGELSYDQAADDITTLSVDVTFKYQQYTIVAL